MRRTLLSPARRRALRKRPPIRAVRRFAEDYWVPWAHVPVVRALVLRRRRPTERPILVIGLPRAGTSWIGEVLGSATGACYLREPLTQTDDEHPMGLGWVDDASTARDDPLVRTTIEDAFAGLPRFTRRINPHREAFSPLGRVQFVVVKEVNPLWLDDLCATHDPIVVHVLRHPAGVASSWDAMGWLTPATWPASLAPRLESLGLGTDRWVQHGAWQAALHRHVAARRPQAIETEFEALALDPLRAFAGLFEAVGLPWDARIARFVAERTRGDRGGPYDTRRHSAQRAEAWRARLEPEQQAALRRGWDALDVPWYRSDAAW